MSWSKLFRYDSESGWLHWRQGPRASKRAGYEWSNPQRNNRPGCVYVMVAGKMLKAHRVIWEMHYGPIPDGMVVDHKDRDPWNNHLDNLRLATPSQNNVNNSRPGRSRGVYAHRNGTFHAHYWSGNKKFHLGTFKTEDEAAGAYRTKMLSLHGDFVPRLN
jgi:hypothetical protein